VLFSGFVVNMLHPAVSVANVMTLPNEGMGILMRGVLPRQIVVGSSYFKVVAITDMTWLDNVTHQVTKRRFACNKKNLLTSKHFFTTGQIAASIAATSG
jgi:hypothetical protein